MIKVLQISIEINSGSVGRIAEQIGETIISNGWASYITYARNINPSNSKVLKIGNNLDIYRHGIETRIFDNHGFGSRKATKRLINEIKVISPDIIHLHHLHGYFLNIELLFKYLNESQIPIVWTFHDCWSFTGHCAYFDFVGCEKWKSQCFDCEQKHEYPKSLIFDRSKLNYIDKKRIFNSVKNMTIVPVSNWLSNKVNESFLKEYPCKVIHNGIDLKVFYPRETKKQIMEKYHIKSKYILLGVASTWEKRKGLEEFFKLSKILSDDFTIILVGLNQSQIDKLPSNIMGIKRTENTDELAILYSGSDVFINPTLEDTFPTTNLESLACGTPVVTYRTGGSVESVIDETGLIVEKGDIMGIYDAVNTILKNGKKKYHDNCRKNAEINFNKDSKFIEYLDLYKSLINL